jgi:uncharacterized protein YkwD
MKGKRTFRPTMNGGWEQMESRVALSHVGIAHVAALSLHQANVHRLSGIAHHRVSIARVPAAHLRVVPTMRLNFHIPVATPPTSSSPVTTSSPPASSAPTQSAPANPTSVGIPSVSGVMSAEEQSIVDLINQQRQQAGLAPLAIDSRLVKAAQIQSVDMAELGTMSHVLSGAALSAPQDRAQYVGYNFSWLGENIAFNYSDAQSVVNAWMNSPDHRANILNPNFTQTGVGVAFDSQGNPYYTQEFGAPA